MKQSLEKAGLQVRESNVGLFVTDPDGTSVQIWADQSWGRFWGWDPKENGAAMIVVWNAVVLHARWGGIVRERGVMLLAIFGNIMTAWSWFGTNMLGIGLHAYGFMESAPFYLGMFICSQIALIALGALLPHRMWRSEVVPAGFEPVRAK